MPNAPIIYTWTDDGHMVPLPHLGRRCDQAFVVGQRYRLLEADERSSADHAHYFAVLHDMWQSLPDHMLEQFPSEDVLRKHALVMAGFSKERRFAMDSREAARKLARELRPRDLEDDYAIVSVNEFVVIEKRPLSQSRKGMPEKGQFHRSKTAVLEWVADLIGVEKGDIPKEEAA